MLAIDSRISKLRLDPSVFPAALTQRDALAATINNDAGKMVSLTQAFSLRDPTHVQWTLVQSRASRTQVTTERNQLIAALKIASNSAILAGLPIRPIVRQQLIEVATKARSNGRRKPVIRPQHFTPLRYPGGKGKLAPFIKAVIESNDLLDGDYCEPYAGGAAIGVELLLQEYVRSIHINDINRAVYAFWDSILNQTEGFLRLLRNTPLSLDSWDRQKNVYRNADKHSNLSLGFATFFLNRTNRSGIFNAGVIGGRRQEGSWTMAARFNAADLSRRIEIIAAYRDRIHLSCKDAIAFLRSRHLKFNDRTLIYLDPPYYTKGKDLYYDYYEHQDHEAVATYVKKKLRQHHWIVSYDNVKAIRTLYASCRGIAYGLGYSAREVRCGSEVMFFSDNLFVPNLSGGMRTLVGGARPERAIGFQPRARERTVVQKARKLVGRS